MAGERQELMAASPSLWEQAMLLVHVIFEQLQQQLGQPPRYVLTGGTLPALLRHGTGAREIDGVLDFVDKDIDILLVANTAADWWATIVALEQLLVSNGWQGCALSARDSGDMATEFELEMLQMQTGVPVSSRGVMELVCALFGSDSVNHTQRAIVPLNVVWVQPFRFRQLVAGRRMYQVSKVPGPGDVLIASSACSILPKHRDRGHCFALPHFPLQSWRGVLPFQSLVPSKSCVYLPVTRLMQHIVTENPDENRYGPSVSVPCPPQPVRLLRWYDRGELWGRLTERPCLAMPLVLDHDRVNNTQTRTLKEQGLSHVGIKTIVERMLLLEMLGGEICLKRLEIAAGP